MANKQKIRIRLRAYDHELIDSSAQDSREQFEQRTHKRLIDILNPNQKTLESLKKLNLPSGVDIEIKL